MLNGWSVHGFLSRRMAEHSPPMVEEVKLYEVAKSGYCCEVRG